MWMRHRILSVVGLLLIASSGCGDDSSELSPDATCNRAECRPQLAASMDDPFGTPSAEEAEPVWAEITEPVISMRGGDSLTGGSGNRGGAVTIHSAGSIEIDPAVAAPEVPATPAIPAGGVELTAADLTGDVTRSETLRLGSFIQLTGSDAMRSIVSSNGDIVVDGTVRTADLGANGQSITLRAPAGTVYVTGVIDTRGSDVGRSGSSGGEIRIVARQVVITDGTVLSAGERLSGGPGGNGGAVFIQATAGPVLITESGTIDSSGAPGTGRGGKGGNLSIVAATGIYVVGKIDTMGGSADSDVEATGGAGGTVRLTAGTDVVFVGSARLRGGAAIGDGSLIGGAAGDLIVSCNDVAHVGGIVDARGGPTRIRNSGDAKAGAGGDLFIGPDGGRPEVAQLSVSIATVGGAGVAIGGLGGALELVASNGDLRFAGAANISGGNSGGASGAAGPFTIQVGPHAGGLTIAGTVVAVGGSGLSGTDGNGGRGADVRSEVISPSGFFTVDVGGRVMADGGDGAGSGRAGNGGTLDFRTRDGDTSMGGYLSGRGGDAAGGPGGEGGWFNLWTDTDADGIGGHLVIEPTGVIDMSGGSGTVGGSGRNNGGHGTGNFPVDREEISILLNSETIPGPPVDGSLLNNGLLISKGGSPNGWGGDIIFHGRRPGGEEDPLPGNLIQDGDGTGEDGDFTAE